VPVGMLVEGNSVVMHRLVEGTALEGAWVVEGTLAGEDRLVADTQVEEGTLHTS
jgi:hypothetical protein